MMAAVASVRKDEEIVAAEIHDLDQKSSHEQCCALSTRLGGAILKV
jgi:hypothetical protein